jgi:hypothetical protein
MSFYFIAIWIRIRVDPHSFSKLDPEPHSLKKLDLDPDPHKVNAETKTAGTNNETRFRYLILSCVPVV